MNRKYRISRDANTDLIGIWNYLAESSSFDIADKVIADLRAGMDRLGESPGMGHQRPDLTELPVHFYGVHSYLIVYDRTRKPISIVRVLHSSRDIPRILNA